MNTSALIIRRATAKDAAAYCRQMADVEVFGNLMQLPYPAEETWAQTLADNLLPGRTDLSLLAERDGEVLGTAGLHPVPRVRRRHAAMMGISVAREWQGQGVGTALMQAICDFADNWGHLLRIELSVFADNERAIKLYRRFGFEHEGLHPAYALRNGRYEDVISMGRLHPSPPTIPAR